MAREGFPIRVAVGRRRDGEGRSAMALRCMIYGIFSRFLTGAGGRLRINGSEGSRTIPNPLTPHLEQGHSPMAINFFEETDGSDSGLEYLIELGQRGNHVLFDTDVIKKAFARDLTDLSGIDQSKVAEVNRAIRDIVMVQGLEAKRDFIRELPSDVQDVIVHLYFQMIDRSLSSKEAVRH